MPQQTNVYLRGNSTRVIDCVEWLLRQINPANNDANRQYNTTGVAVDRTRDTSKAVRDTNADYLKYGTLIRIKESGSKILSGPGVQIGNARRDLFHIELHCWQTISDTQVRAGVTADQIMGWLRDDIDSALSTNPEPEGIDCIQRASNALQLVQWYNMPVGTWGILPSCMYLHTISYMAGPMALFPEFAQVIHIQYRANKSRSDQRPGIS